MEPTFLKLAAILRAYDELSHAEKIQVGYFLRGQNEASVLIMAGIVIDEPRLMRFLEAISDFSIEARLLVTKVIIDAKR